MLRSLEYLAHHDRLTNVGDVAQHRGPVDGGQGAPRAFRFLLRGSFSKPSFLQAVAASRELLSSEQFLLTESFVDIGPEARESTETFRSSQPIRRFLRNSRFSLDDLRRHYRPRRFDLTHPRSRRQRPCRLYAVRAGTALGLRLLNRGSSPGIRSAITPRLFFGDPTEKLRHLAVHAGIGRWRISALGPARLISLVRVGQQLSNDRHEDEEETGNDGKNVPQIGREKEERDSGGKTHCATLCLVPPPGCAIAWRISVSA